MLLPDDISDKIIRIESLKDGQEVILRLAEQKDYELVWASYKAQPASFYDFLPQFSEEMVKSWYETINHDFAIPINAFLRENCLETKFLGNCTFLRLPHEEMSHVMGWGINVISEYQGMGLGKLLLSTTIEVARDYLNIKRLELEVICENQRAIKLYEQLGFEIEGTLKKRWCRNNQFRDMHIMALLLD